MRLLFILLIVFTSIIIVPPSVLFALYYLYERYRQRAQANLDVESGLGGEDSIALLKKGDLAGFIIRTILEGADDF